MPPEVRSLLFDILHNAMGIQSFVDGKTLADYLSDRMLRLATERQFEVIGEAMNRLRRVDEATVMRITAYLPIIHFRNFLIHAYDHIDDTRVWQIIESHLPTLLSEVKALLDEAQPSQ